MRPHHRKPDGKVRSLTRAFVQSFHSYFSSEHSRLLALWRQVVGFRRHVCELKSATERSDRIPAAAHTRGRSAFHTDALCLSSRDLSEARNELACAAQSVQLQCVSACAALRSRENGSAQLLERETGQRLQLEQQLRDTVTEMMTLQAKSDSERAELNTRCVTAHTYTLNSDPRGPALINTPERAHQEHEHT